MYPRQSMYEISKSNANFNNALAMFPEIYLEEASHDDTTKKLKNQSCAKFVEVLTTIPFDKFILRCWSNGSNSMIGVMPALNEQNLIQAQPHHLSEDQVAVVINNYTELKKYLEDMLVQAQFGQCRAIGFPEKFKEMDYLQTIFFINLLNKDKKIFTLKGLIHLEKEDCILLQILPPAGWEGKQSFCENIYITYNGVNKQNFVISSLRGIWFDLDDGFVAGGKNKVTAVLQQQFEKWKHGNYEGQLFAESQFALSVVNKVSPRQHATFFAGVNNEDTNNNNNTSAPRFA